MSSEQLPHSTPIQELEGTAFDSMPRAFTFYPTQSPFTDPIHPKSTR